MFHLEDEINVLQRICQLINMKASGTPKNLASQMNISERTVYRFIDFLKTKGFPIKYNKLKQHYECDRKIEVMFKCEFEAMKEDEMTKIVGGGVCLNSHINPNKNLFDMYRWENSIRDL